MNRRQFLIYAGAIVTGCELEGIYDFTTKKPVPPVRAVKPMEPVDMKKIIVAEVMGQSYMSLAQLLNGNILAGTYSLQDPVEIHCVGYGKVDSVDVGESVFRITEDHGYVYLACERRSIYRDIVRTDPMRYNFKFYRRLARGVHQGAYDVKRLLGELIFVGGGEIYTDGYGTSKEWDDEYYVKFAFQCRNEAFVGGYSYQDQCAGWFVGDCFDWEWENIGPKYSRFMAAAVTANQRFIYMVGTNKYRDEHNHNAATLWRYEVSLGTLVQLWSFPGFDYSPAIKISSDGRIFLMLSKGWKSWEPGAMLVEWSGRKPHVIEEFDEAEGRELVIDGNDIYCATKDRVRGRVYKLPGVL